MPGQPGSETRQRTKVLSVRVDDADHDRIRRRAEDAGDTISEYMRQAALGARIASAVDKEALADLNRLGGLLKWGLTHGWDAPPTPLPDQAASHARQLLDTLAAAIKRLTAAR